MAVDRADMQFAVKESARAMSRPKAGRWQLLRRISKHLTRKPRPVMYFPWQSEEATVTTFTDSDWAGCCRTARSTSGGIITIGSHMIKTYSRQINVFALRAQRLSCMPWWQAASTETVATVAYAKNLFLNDR